MNAGRYTAKEQNPMKLATLLIAPAIGIVVCLVVLNVMDRGYQGSMASALGQSVVIGLLMAPAAYAAEFGLFLPVHRYLVRKNVTHVRAYATAGLVVGAISGPLGFALTVAVIAGIVERQFALPLANAPALRATTIAGACAGIIAALVFRAMWTKWSSQ